MSILLNEKTRVCVQGITGREGAARTRLMIDYGTQVVAGVTPGKGGQVVHGVPVYDTVVEAVQAVGPFDINVIFVPAPLVKDAAMEAIAAGTPLVVLVPDRVPLYDVLELDRFAQAHGARFLGPNTIGMASPGKATIGMLGGRDGPSQSTRHRSGIMATCPECEEDLEIDEIDVDEGDIITCDQCGSTLRVISISPIELEAYEEDDEDEDDLEDEDEDDEDEDEDDDEDWDE